MSFMCSRPPCLRATLRVGGALLLGYAQALSIALPAAWPSGGQALWWLQILATAGLFALLQTSTRPRHAAGLAFAFAFAWLCGCVHWIYHSLHIYGGLAAPLAALAVAALCAFMSLFFALAAWIYKKISRLRQENQAREALLFIAFWLLAELARNSWFTGLPWGASAYAQVDGPLAFLAPYGGVYGIALVANALACSVAWMLMCTWKRCVGQDVRKQMRFSVVLYVLLLLVLVLAPRGLAKWGSPRPASHAPLSVDLLQGNISQGEKFEPSSGIPLALSWYKQQLLQSTADLVVTPETAIPLLPDELPDGYWLGLQQAYTRAGRAALVGMPLGNAEDGYRNAVVGLKPSAAPTHYAYFKQHLVPFGEFIPPMFRWFTNLLHIPLGDFARGDYAQASFDWAGERFAPNICYEDLFGEELAARFVGKSPPPTVLVNLSNLGWFGDGAILDQDRNIARMRSLELDRPTLRATNTGVTALIDRQGRVQAELPRVTRGVLRVQVAGNDGVTFFARWAGRYGQLPLWLVAFTLILIAGLAGNRVETAVRQRN